jgi:hypothetical protein
MSAKQGLTASGICDERQQFPIYCLTSTLDAYEVRELSERDCLRLLATNGAGTPREDDRPVSHLDSD